MSERRVIQNIIGNCTIQRHTSPLTCSFLMSPFSLFSQKSFNRIWCFIFKMKNQRGMTETKQIIKLNGDQCVVCYQDCKQGDRVHCHGHYTCRTCLKSWVRQDATKINKCPLCLSALPTQRSLKKRQKRNRARRWNSSRGNQTAPIEDLTMHWLQSRAKRCPSCSIYIEKKGGCDQVRCRCGTDFCY